MKYKDKGVLVDFIGIYEPVNICILPTLYSVQSSIAFNEKYYFCMEYNSYYDVQKGGKLQVPTRLREAEVSVRGQ